MDEGQARAVETKKPLLVYYTADWSKTAGQFEDQVLTDAGVKAKLTGFVTVKIDADADATTPAQYNVGAFPTTIFYDAGGTEVKRLVGVVTPADFLKIMDDVLQGRVPMETDLLAREAKNPEDLRLVYDVATYYVTNGHPEKAKPRLEKVLNQDPANKTGCVPGALMQLGFIELAAQQPEAALEKFNAVLETYPTAPEAAKCQLYVGDAYQLMDETDEAVAAYEKTTKGYPGTPEAEEAATKLGRLTGLERTVEAFTSRGGSATKK
jgi:TolA-binding protein